MEYYSIGELCSIIKGSTGIMKAVPGPYPLVTTGPDRKSSNEYEFDDDAVCIPLVSSTGHGHKSLNYIHYQSGKFALGTILAAVIPKDKTVLSAEYLQRYLFFFKEQLVVPLMKGAANVSLAVKDIAKIHVPVPPISKQKEFIELFNKAENGKQNLLLENQNQSTYLTKLRQAILQEAIEGKLTADWRKENPVRKGDPDYDSESLLEKIQTEKEKLIKEGKIKKQKPLAPLKADEVPFELPEGWVWTRLEDLGLFGRGKSKHRPRNDSSLFKDGNYPFVQTGEVAQSKKTAFKIYKAEKFYNKKGLAQSKLWPCGTLCITIAANIAETGFLTFDACFPDSVVGFTSLSGSFTPWYTRYFLSCAQDDLMKYAPATAQKNINLEIISKLVFPTPPLAEQKAIVERVEKLLFMVDELEKQVSERKEQSEQFMQAVLREAFEGGN